MAETGDHRYVQAARFSDYFALQLLFAEAVAIARGEALGEVVRRFTNLHRRLALGEVDEGEPGPAWRAFAAGLEARHAHADRLAWTLAALAAAPDEPPQATHVRFGCFAFEPPAGGLVRIHFNNRDSTPGAGPLARSRRGARTAELSRMFAHLRSRHPDARQVAGASWLYHTEAYRSLFPADYVASRRIAEPVRLTGTSSWGQFLTHEGGVKPDLRAAFVARFDDIDPDQPWTIFPLRPLAVTAPVESFYRHFGVD